ncbi:MAG: zinc ribbon domain-containing protein, partial [Gemmatimonadales bacterium]
KLEFVRGAKEASAIMAELDLARTVMAQAEAVWLKSADQLQQAELRAREVSEALDETRADQAPLRSEIEGKRTAVQVRIDAATAEREDARKSVRQDLLTRYERIKKGNARQALHGVANGACGNCFTAVPRHIQQQLRTPGTIDHCQGCGVMLYLPVS